MKLITAKFFIFLLVFVLSVSGVLAAVKLGNKSAEIQDIYAPKETIKGWLNISLENIYTDSLLTSNFGDSIKIIDFLKGNSISTEDYSCMPQNCEDDYKGTNSESGKIFSLGDGENKTLGVKVQGQIESIDTLKFSVQGSSSASCKAPLIIDLLDDRLLDGGSLDYISQKTTDEFSCWINRTGCFELAQAINEPAYIRTEPYCGKIRLPASSKYKLGAWLKNGTKTFSGGLLKMQLYDEDGNIVECELPAPSSTGSEISCQLNYTNPKERDFYVCIIATEETDYEIKHETNNPCGFSGNPEDMEGYERDYYIFAEAARFANIGDFEFNETEFQRLNPDSELSSHIMQYMNKYDGNCSSGCIIPLTFLSGGNIQLSISNLFLRYTTSISTSTSSIYDAEKKPAKLSSGFLVLDLEKAGFKAPSSYGNSTLTIKLDNEGIASKKITVEKVPVIRSLSPMQAIAALPTKFTADAYSPANNTLVKYTWNFGNNETKETQNNTITYTYLKVGSYKLKLSVEDKKGFVGAREFSINASTPEKILNTSFERARKTLENITKQAGNMGWYSNKIKESLKLGEIEEYLKNLEKLYITADSTEDYVDIMANLTKLELPYQIKVSEEGNLPAYFFSNRINLEHVANATETEYEKGKEGQYRDAITDWLINNIDTSIVYKKISGYYPEDVKTIALVYSIDLKKKNEIPESFLIIESTGVVFKEEYNKKETEDFVGIGFSDNMTIEFFVEEPKNIDELPIYISPPLTELENIQPTPCNFNRVCEKGLGEDYKNCKTDCKRYGLLVLYILIVLLGIFVLYIVLQEWYKKRYESHLFKNKDELYNLINFINNASNQKLNDNEIIEKLKNSGWQREQIIYALKKFRGKRTGMLEIPIFRFIEKRRIEKEIAKRQPPMITGPQKADFFKQKV